MTATLTLFGGYSLKIIPNFNAGDNWGTIPHTRAILFKDGARVDGADFEGAPSRASLMPLLSRHGLEGADLCPCNRNAPLYGTYGACEFCKEANI